MEYYYSARAKKWLILGYKSKYLQDSYDEADPDTLALLKSKDRNKYFLKFKNRYNPIAIDGKYIYVKPDKVKAIIGDSIFIYYETTNSSSSQLWETRDLMNPKILETISVDPLGVVDFMDRVIYFNSRGDEEERDNYRRHLYWLNKLDKNQRLVYKLAGHYPGKIYDDDNPENN